MYVNLDDVLAIGQTFQDHLANLKNIFTRLMEADLLKRTKLKPTKCKLAQRMVDFLGSGFVWWYLCSDGCFGLPKAH